MTDFKKYLRSGDLKTAFKSMQDLVKQALAAGFGLIKSKASNSIIHHSKAGNPQIILRNNDDTLFVRISDNAIDAIVAGANPTELPVYDITLYEDNDPTKQQIGNILVIGINGSENPDWELADANALQNLLKVVPKTVSA